MIMSAIRRHAHAPTRSGEAHDGGERVLDGRQLGGR
jgi:hypothetical protein